MRTHRKHTQHGASLVEVLVAMVILAVGLLGLVGLQARLHVLQMESYQRAQALILLGDMANRIVLNRNSADSYAAAAPIVGVGAACPAANTTRTERDVREWCLALQGAAETSAGGTNVGVMVGGRGCIEETGVDDEYLITVAWQGLAPLSPPPDSVTCGETLYGDAGTPCEDELCRRVVTTLVQIADLDPPPPPP